LDIIFVFSNLKKRMDFLSRPGERLVCWDVRGGTWAQQATLRREIFARRFESPRFGSWNGTLDLAETIFSVAPCMRIATLLQT
jgi:hypothetical protein